MVFPFLFLKNTPELGILKNLFILQPFKWWLTVAHLQNN